jgi:hypothetical protein
MGYCTVDEVAQDFKNITISSTSSVSTTDIEKMVEQESNFIDSKICSLYKIPVVEGTSPKAFSVLKRIAIFLVSDRVRHILHTKTGQDNKDQDTKGLRSLSRTPRKDLEEIQKGTLKLIDAEALNSLIGFDVGDVPDCDSRVFDVTKQQW